MGPLEKLQLVSGQFIHRIYVFNIIEINHVIIINYDNQLLRSLLWNLWRFDESVYADDTSVLIYDTRVNSS